MSWDKAPNQTSYGRHRPSSQWSNWNNPKWQALLTHKLFQYRTSKCNIISNNLTNIWHNIIILVSNEMFHGSGYQVRLVSRLIDHTVSGQNGTVQDDKHGLPPNNSNNAHQNVIIGNILPKFDKMIMSGNMFLGSRHQIKLVLRVINHSVMIKVE